MKKIFFTLSFLPIFFLAFALPSLTLAANPGGGAAIPPANSGAGGNIPPANPGGGGAIPSSVDASFRIENPFKVGDNLFDLMNSILTNIIMPIGGILCVLGFIWAGFQYVIAQGNPSKITDAHRTLRYTALGTAILLGATAIELLVRNTFTSLLQ